MKTYKTTVKLGRVASYLIAVNYPFHFDGFEIEFTCSKEFLERMIMNDPSFVTSMFE